MKLIIFIIATLIAINNCNADYFWREYFGTIPHDAVPGIKHENGNITYIGQSFVQKRNGVFSGSIYENDKHVHVAFSPPIKTDMLNKILCSHDLYDIAWVKTNISQLHLLTYSNPIIGGFDDKTIMLIGRVNYQGETYLGRVYDYAPLKWHHIVIQDKANKLVNFNEFEVLTYGLYVNSNK